MRRNTFDEMDRLFDQLRRSMFDVRSNVGYGMDDAKYGIDDATFGFADANLRLDVDDEGYVAHADLPGFEKEEIDLWFDDGTLTVEAVQETDGDGERRTRRVRESIHIPEPVVEEDITAEYHNGVLAVTIPMVDAPEGETGRRIDID